MVEAMFEAFQLAQCLTIDANLANKQNHYLTLRTEWLLVFLSSCKHGEAMLKQPCWQSQLSLGCLAIGAVHAVPEVAH